MIRYSIPCISCGEELIVHAEKNNVGKMKITCSNCNCKEENVYDLNKIPNPDVKYNIIVLGKTGVGKSSLINYLYGEEAREIGSGKPVTGKKFEEIELKINGMETKIFDSWGLEASKADEWNMILDNELKDRDVFSEIKDWFHTVFYCISAGGARVEDFEIELINKFIDAKYKVNIIFTKADQSTEEEIKKLKKVLNKNLDKETAMIAVCNEEKELISGNKIEAFGKKKIEKAIIEGFWDSIVMRTPERCIKTLLEEVDCWHQKQKNYIEENFGFFSQKKVAQKINEEIEDFIELLDKKIIGEVIFKELKDVIDFYNQISESYISKLNQIKLPSFQELLISLKKSDDEDISEFSAILEGAIIAGGGAALAKGIGALLLFKIPIFWPAAIAGLLISIGRTNSNKEKLINSFNETSDEMKNGIKEIEPKLNKVLVKVKSYEY